ncbi:hypothetical protein Tco_0033500 [Tanacetum coccineum]
MKVCSNHPMLVLKRDCSYKDSDINGLEKQLERLKKEKEENQFKIDNYENAFKSLEQLTANQISDNNKKGPRANNAFPTFHFTRLVAPIPSVDISKAKDSEVCKITRADGTSSFHGDFQALLRRLDRQDLFQLYSLVQERYKHRSIEGHDLDLWGDLKMIGVHSLFVDGTSIQINMLVDKKYPLKKEILKKMINLKIEAEEESDMASELINFIKSQIAEQS